MAREVPEIDRLIEEGLTLYGQGDLDGALARWERALLVDPDNAQANSYVDYVQQNYDLLTAEARTEATAEGAPFGIADDEPEYQIEIQPGEIKATNPTIGPPMFMDPLDEGWFIDEATRQRGHGGPPGIGLDGRPSQELTMELEADEPPERPPPPDEAPTPRPKRPASVLTIEADEPPEPNRPLIPDDAPTPRAKRPSQMGMDFDDDTREYDKKRHKSEPPDSDSTGFTPLPSAGPGADEFGPDGTPGFGHPNDFQTPPGFGTQTTGIKQRDLGFVQATAGKPPTGPGKPQGPAGKPMTSTDLGLPDRPRAPAKPSQPPATLPANSLDELTLEPSDRPPPPDEAPTLQRPPIQNDDLDDLDLITSLPSPRPKPRVAQVAIDTPLSGAIKHTTRDFPHQTRAPAVPATKTKELSPSDLMPSVGSAQTQDFDVKTQERNRALDRTQDIPNMQQAARLSAVDNPVVSAPTRDLGLREASARGESIASGRGGTGDGTRADVVLPFDPIDARAYDIIEVVDENAPAKEAPEDKTRRRITTLFEKAAQWTGEGDLERAVAAVDLALSEDPNSALAQKLIHRNRDTMMTVFQAYLGDLQRTPQLARPLHELANAPISPRAAFLLSRIDGLLSVDEILDVCGMPRLEAFRHLCQLFLRGILR